MSDGPEKTYQQFLAAGEFRLQRCVACGAHVFYPRHLCPGCGSSELDWVRASGEGVVHSTTVMRRRPERGGDLNVALVDLAEGPRLMSRVEGLPPEQVAIGLRVRARIAAGEGEERHLVFDPADGVHGG